jgi:hypothetical protein
MRARSYWDVVDRAVLRAPIGGDVAAGSQDAATETLDDQDPLADPGAEAAGLAATPS